MILQTWGSAALLVAASALVGGALNALGMRCRDVAPAVGLALIVVVAYAAIRLPGRAVAAVVALVVLTLAAAAVLLTQRRRRRLDPERRVAPGRRRLGAGLAIGVTIAVAALGAAVPFLANGHMGLPGVSLDNDTAPHLIWAEALRSPIVGDRYGLNMGYPLGPHSLAAALGTGLGLRLDMAFTAILIATVIITAIVGTAVLAGEAAWKRPVAGVLAALFYLVAVYYAEGAFKEPMLGLLLLAMVLQLEQVHRQWTAGARSRWLVLLPIAVLVAGGVYIYSYLAFAWFGLTLAIWIALELAVRWRWLWASRRALPRLRAWVLDPGLPAAAAVVVMVVLLLPLAGRILSYIQSIGLSPAGSGAISASNFGNLPHPLSSYEALGIWQSPDFRFTGANVFHQGELSALALGVLLLGMVRSLSRREFLFPAAVAACAFIYWRSSHGQSPYVTAKALVIAGPVVAAVAMRGLLRGPAPPEATPLWATLSRWAVAVAFVAFAVNSSLQALRNEPVGAPESNNELLALAKATAGQNLLFLGNSDYAPWLFHNSNMSALSSTTISLAQAAARPRKPFAYGTALDFDSVEPSTINHFEWVITTNTPYASQPPPAFRLVRRLPMYELWRRVGLESGTRQLIEPSGAPGAPLDCRNRLARAFSRKPGIAAVMATPRTVSLSELPPGDHERVTLRLPAGRWNLSLKYISPIPVSLEAGGQTWRMPAYVDRPGPVFTVGSLDSTGAPVRLTIRAQAPSFLTGPNLIAGVGTLYLTRLPDVRTTVPLSQSCGRYIDWYRLAS